jgi:hypothetical protein
MIWVGYVQPTIHISVATSRDNYKIWQMKSSKLGNHITKCMRNELWIYKQE